MKAEYRSKIGVTLDILKAIKEKGSDGILLSHISTNVRLAHKPVFNRVHSLMDCGLVLEKEVGKQKLDGTKKQVQLLYCVTEKGLNIINEMVKFEELCKEYLGMKL